MDISRRSSPLLLINSVCINCCSQQEGTVKQLYSNLSILNKCMLKKELSLTTVLLQVRV
jgi:hypothetical protein